MFEQFKRFEPGAIDGWLHSARLCEAEGELEQAFHFYNNVLQLNPDHPDALHGTVRYYRHYNSDREAIRVLEKLVLLFPHDFGAQITLRECRLTLAEKMSIDAEIEQDRDIREELQYRVALEYKELHGDEKVIQYIGELHIMHELNDALYVLWAQACHRQDRNQEATAVLRLSENAFRPEKESGFEIYFERGQLYLEMENSAKALPDLKRATQLDPEHAKAWHLLAYAAHLQVHNELSIQYSDKAIALDPDTYEYRSLRAYVYYNNKCFEEALQDYRYLETSDDDYPVDWLQKGIAHLKLGQYEQSIRAFEVSQSEEQSPENLLEVPYYLSIVYAKLRQTDKALECIRQFRRGKPGDSRGPLLEGDIFREQGWSRQAIDVYKQGLEQFPDDEELARMTILCAMDADPQESHAILNEMARKMWDMSSLKLWGLLFVARYLIEAQDWERFRSCFEIYLDGEPPENIDSHIWLYAGICAYRTGHLDEALLELGKAYEEGHGGEVCSYLSMVYYDMGNIEMALNYADEAIREQPEHPDYIRRHQGMQAQKSRASFSLRDIFKKRKPAYEQWPSMIPLQYLVPEEPVSLHFV